MVTKDFQNVLQEISGIAVSATDAADLTIKIYPVYMRDGLEKARVYLDFERSFRAKPQ